MIPAVDIATISEELRRLGEEVVTAYEDVGASEDTDPRVLLIAAEEVFDQLRRVDNDQGPGDLRPPAETVHHTNGVQTLGDHGIDLLARLAALADRLRLPRESREIEGLTFPLACWAVRHGAEIVHLSPVVNAAAALANRLREPMELATLCALLGEIIAAVSPQVSQDTDSRDPSRPWRVLLLNRAIVATRSHQPMLMDEAFDALGEHLPEDAPSFFREGMEQMELLDYPAHVRAVMQRYYDRWCKQRALH